MAWPPHKSGAASPDCRRCRGDPSTVAVASPPREKSGSGSATNLHVMSVCGTDTLTTGGVCGEMGPRAMALTVCAIVPQCHAFHSQNAHPAARLW